MTDTGWPTKLKDRRLLGDTIQLDPVNPGAVWYFWGDGWELRSSVPVLEPGFVYHLKTHPVLETMTWEARGYRWTATKYLAGTEQVLLEGRRLDPLEQLAKINPKGPPIQIPNLLTLDPTLPEGSFHITQKVGKGPWKMVGRRPNDMADRVIGRSAKKIWTHTWFDDDRVWTVNMYTERAHTRPDMPSKLIWSLFLTQRRADPLEQLSRVNPKDYVKKALKLGTRKVANEVHDSLKKLSTRELDKRINDNVCVLHLSEKNNRWNGVWLEANAPSAEGGGYAWRVINARGKFKKSKVIAQETQLRTVQGKDIGIDIKIEQQFYDSGDKNVPDDEFIVATVRCRHMDPLELLSRIKYNPKVGGVDLYDPSMEQNRAQRQAIYEARVKKLLGVKSSEPFRSPSGQRLDAYKLTKHGKNLALAERGTLRQLKEAVGYAFGAGTSVQQRQGMLFEGSQAPTAAAKAKARERYKDPDTLLRNRQDYEETLALARKSFYRVTREGKNHFVWPMPPGMKTPIAMTVSEAKSLAARLNESKDPRLTGTWWKPSKSRYTSAMLRDWLDT